MPSPRTYGQKCRIAQSLDLIGERWTLLIVRDLLLGPKRFGDLEASLKGIGTNLLTARLKELESRGIVERRELGGGLKRKAYALTPLGEGLENVLREMMRWSVRLPEHELPVADFYQPEWDLVALKLLYRSSPGPPLEGCIRLIVDDIALAIKVDAAGLSFPGHDESQPDATLSADRSAVLDLVFGRVSAERLHAKKALVIEGDTRFALRWADRFDGG